MKRPLLLLVACLVLYAYAFPSLAQIAGVPSDGRLDFAVYREGDEIGSHSFAFRVEGPELSVEVVTDVAVDVAFITVFRFEHRARELWREGKLVSLTSESDDDGEDHSLTVTARGESLEVIGNGVRSTADASILPASFWDSRTVERSQILNVLDGRIMKVQIADRGEEAIVAKGAPVKARHYVMTGEFQRELWYDADGVLVRMAFKGRDGSDIQFVLK